MRRNWDGAILAALALLYLVAAREFQTGFIADPIGPRAFPIGIGLLAALVGLALFFTERGTRPEPMDTPARLRSSLLTIVLFAYAFLLEPLGFILSTAFAMTALVGLFRGRIVHGLAFGFLVGVLVFFLFGYALSLPLPVGRLFTGF